MIFNYEDIILKICVQSLPQGCALTTDLKNNLSVIK